MEKRILFRLLSGLHSSIMTQIANDYRFDGESARAWVLKDFWDIDNLFLLPDGLAGSFMVPPRFGCPKML